jgi:plastocyanin
MGKRFIFAVLSISLAFSCQSGPATVAEEDEIKVEVQVVNITTDKGLSTATINAKRGTTVIWVNKTFVPQEILFTDKKIVSACDAPVNFFVGKERAYESGKIPFGGIASLCFIEKGKYKYELRSSKTFYESYAPTKREYKGSISIK